MKGITDMARDERATLLNRQEIGTYLTVADGVVGYVYVREDYSTSPHLIWRMVGTDVRANSWMLIPHTVAGDWSLS